MPVETESQRRRAAEARDEARRSAKKAEAQRTLVQRSGARVLTFRQLDGSLSDSALLVLNYVVEAWKAADQRPVPLHASDLTSALGLPLAVVQTAYTELADKKLIISAKDIAGVTRVQPGLTVARA